MGKRQKDYGKHSKIDHNDIPSNGDYAKADAAHKKRHRGLKKVAQKILDRFQSRGEIRGFFLFYCSENSFLATVIYNFDQQIKESEESGLDARIRKAVFEEMENVGRGDRSSIEIEFEFDSHENVKKNYGNYYNRFR